jgi:phage shock protein E
MKRSISTLSFLLIAGTVTFAQTTHEVYTQKSTNKIKVTPAIGQTLLEQIQQGNAYLVDVRTPEEYNAEHLQYALNANIRGTDFNGQLAKLDKSKTIYLYCHSGNRSGKATDSLLVLGFKNSYNIGALDSLKKIGFLVSN